MLLIKQNLNQITKGLIIQKEYPFLPYFTSIKDKPKHPLTLTLMVINLAHWWVEKGQESLHSGELQVNAFSPSQVLVEMFPLEDFRSNISKFNEVRWYFLWN